MEPLHAPMLHEQTPATGHGPSPSEDDNGHYPIGKLARLAGVSTRTVRYYEEIGLLRVARRYAGGRRVFDADALQRMRFIGRLKALGFSLDEIGHLNHVFELSRSTAEMLRVLDGKFDQHLATLDTRLRELTALRDDIGAYRTHIRRRLAQLGHQASSQPPG